MKTLFLSILFVGLATWILGCFPQGGNQALIEIVGTVRWVDIEGGFLGIVADNGIRYEPLNLPEKYQDGARVHVVARIRDDCASIHMWGTIIEILDIESLS
ncbi:MAG: hypothetical protein ACP5Q4_11130 [Candidatus Caldatribacteriaceae bacterium]